MFESGQEYLTVHALSEFVFCPRAGLIVHELEQVEDERPLRYNVDYVPLYDLASVEEALNRQMNRLWVLLGAMGLLLIVAFVAYLLGRMLFLAPVGLGILWLSWRGTRRLNLVLELAETRSIAHAAVGREPTPKSRQYEAVNWWELLAAGFDSVPYRESLVDDKLGIRGKPWRVLRKGSLRIPVVRLSSDETTDTPRPQHVIGVAAYCHLLRTCEGQESPYGVLLFGNSWDGLAVVACDEIHAELQEAVRLARIRLPIVAQHGSFEGSILLEECDGCRHGRPVVVDAIQGSPWWGEDGAIHGVGGRDGRLYHSCCGDRFEWLPPHRKAVTLKLGE